MREPGSYSKSEICLLFILLSVFFILFVLYVTTPDFRMPSSSSARLNSLTIEGD
jgi:hypothetical protein